MLKLGRGGRPSATHFLLLGVAVSASYRGKLVASHVAGDRRSTRSSAMFHARH